MSWLVEKSWWMEIYENIIMKNLSLNFKADQEATDLLSNVLSSHPYVMEYAELKTMFVGVKEAIVFGCGESLVQDIEYLVEKGELSGKLLIAADGATTILLKHNIIPNIIVSDLDGLIADILRASLNGAVTIIHAHGDNVDRITRFVPMFKGRLLGSTQVEPRPHVYNFGGFTDGDRGVFVALALGINRNYLAGFDLMGEPHSCPGKLVPFNKRVKKRKLEIARLLLKSLQERGVQFLHVGGGIHEL
ncbi:MAG: 6-hydroxymethylpterin diphosphokinase MptE-like protein [Thermosphaera sp.]